MTPARKRSVEPARPALRLVGGPARIGDVGAKRGKRTARAKGAPPPSPPVPDIFGGPPDLPGVRSLPWSTAWVQRTAGAHRSSSWSFDGERYWGRIELELTSDHHMDRLAAAEMLIERAADVFGECGGYEPVHDLLTELVAYLRSPAAAPEVLRLLTFRLAMAREGRFDAAWVVWPFSDRWDQVQGTEIDARLRDADQALAAAQRMREGGEVDAVPCTTDRAALFVARAGLARGNVGAMLRILSSDERDAARKLKADPTLAKRLAACFDGRGNVRRGALPEVVTILRELRLGDHTPASLTVAKSKARKAAKAAALARTAKVRKGS